jgi:hypothetical protein
MKYPCSILVLLAFAATAAAADLGNQAPEKIPGIYPENVPEPIVQGGDNIANARVIPSLPYIDSGTTVGYFDDYQASCVYANGAPDVVYRYVASQTDVALISLCGSTYDTGLYVFDSSLVQIACNDDFCELQSELRVNLTAGQTYYIIVDGYSSASGSYTLDMRWFVPCILSCSPGGFPEGEPALVPDYVDNWNGGCNTDPGHPFQTITRRQYLLCGVSGWYTVQGNLRRDTDWYLLNTYYNGVVEIVADAEYAIYIFELSPQDCASVEVAQQATAGPCQEAFMTIVGMPNTPVWLWVGPTVYANPDGGDNMFDYVVWFQYGISATEPTTWGAIKALYY